MKFFTLLIFILVSQGIKGQEIMEAGSGLYEYKYGDLYYSYEELGEVLKFNPYAYAKYEKSLRKRKTSRVLFSIAGGIGATTIILAEIAGDSGCEFICDSAVYYALGILTLTPILLVATSKNISTGVNKRRSIKIFNDGLFDMGEIDKYKRNSEWSMHFGQSQNGLGLAISF